MDGELDWLDLEDGEEVLWSDTPHPYSLIPTFVVGIALSLVVVGLVIIASAYLTYKNKNYVVTTDALYKKTGVLSINVKRIEFDKVQDTSYRQTFLGTQFGFGIVEVSTAGGGSVELRFEDVSEPQALQSLINKQLRRREGRDSPTDEKAAVLEEILHELRSIRDTIEKADTEAPGTGDPDHRTAGGSRSEPSSTPRRGTENDTDRGRTSSESGGFEGIEESDREPGR